MARPMGPNELQQMAGDHSLRRNELADATGSYISALRSGAGDSLNMSKLGLVLVARIDEEMSFAARALDGATEAAALRNARMSQRRAEAAFRESLAKDHVSSSSALAYFGAAVCAIVVALLLEKKTKKVGAAADHAAKTGIVRPGQHKVVARSPAIAKLNRQATRRYAAAFVRDPEVNRTYDKLLPMHLDAESSRTLDSVHGRFLDANMTASDARVLQAREAEAHEHELEHPVGQDRWSSRVPAATPYSAAVGQHDADGRHAEAELAAFRSTLRVPPPPGSSSFTPA